jgi:hypothetical protein
MTQVVEPLPTKHGAPSSNPSTTKKKKKWGGEFVPQMFPRGPIVEEA